MLAKLEECSLLKKKHNLGNAALKQGKKFNKYSGIVKSNRKVANKSNKVKNDFSLDGYLIEGFQAPDEVTNALTTIRNINIHPPLPPRYEDTSLNDISENVSLDDFTIADIGLKEENNQDGRYTDNDGTMISGYSYKTYIESISAEIIDLNSDISGNNLQKRNFKEDQLFDIIKKKEQEYNQLKSTEVLNGQLNNTQLTNKSYYLQYILWLVAAISMGGLVLKKVFNN